MKRRCVGVVAPFVLAGALVLAGCSSDSADRASAGSRTNDTVATTTTTTPTTTTAVPDSAALCAIFNQLAANGAGRDAQFSATTPEGWERRIEITGEMVDAAPAEWRDDAATYLQMMKDRAQLASENGYVGVNDLPTDVRNAFIDSHRAMQAQVNELIAFMGRECGAQSTG
jgi:hypothetical protein